MTHESIARITDAVSFFIIGASAGTVAMSAVCIRRLNKIKEIQARLDAKIKAIDEAAQSVLKLRKES